jgi:hypothetical protein
VARSNAKYKEACNGNLSQQQQVASRYKPAQITLETYAKPVGQRYTSPLGPAAAKAIQRRTSPAGVKKAGKMLRRQPRKSTARLYG